MSCTDYVTATVLGTERRVATDQPTSVHLQTLQLKEKNTVFSISFSVNRERNYSGNHIIYIFSLIFVTKNSIYNFHTNLLKDN
jgi:hypothetical protein